MNPKEYNVEAFEKLIERYKKITLEEIQEAAKGVVPHGDYFGNLVMEKITGFGNTSQCSLCLATKRKDDKHYNCERCLYTVNSKQPMPCVETTYFGLGKAKTVEEIFNKLQDRIKFLEEVLVKSGRV